MAAVRLFAGIRLSTPPLLAALALLLGGCALPWNTIRPAGEAIVRSPACHCRFSYPAAWYTSSANGDSSLPILGLNSYDTSSGSHAAVPSRYADIGIDWQSDPTGQLYLTATTSHFSTLPGRRLTVSGWPATAYATWTAPPAQGGIYMEHVYVFVPWYQRDYDLWLQAANPPGNDVSAPRRVFTRLLRTLVIVPPNAVP